MCFSPKHLSTRFCRPASHILREPHLTPLIDQRLAEWEERLSTAAGVPLFAAVAEIARSRGFQMLPSGHERGEWRKSG